MPEIAYYNGRFVDINELVVPIEERGHQFGDGIYEVVRVYGGRPFLLDWHLDRMERSLRVIGLDNPIAREEWVHLIGEAVRRSGEAEAQVYWQVTRGIAPRLHTFPDRPPAVALTVRPVAAKATAVNACLLALPDDRWANPFVKSVNLLPNVLAKESARRAGAAEAMLVRDGLITEGSGSNLWFVRNGELCTAPATRYILGGITRQFVLELAERLAIPVCQRAVSLDELAVVDEVFMTSTTQEIVSINRIIADEANLPTLSRLPETAPEHLVQEVVKPVTLWENASGSAVTTKLQTAYAEEVNRFRLYEETIP